jgi:ribosome biogenesis SPOUT family RNA methylase Rps3
MSGVDTSKVCVLDPTAKRTLAPVDAKRFDYFVIGGILGDEAFNGRTGAKITSALRGCAVRNLGSKQFTIDGAAGVTWKILKGAKLANIPLHDGATIAIREGESVDLPYAFPIVDGAPFLSEELVTYLRKKKGF